MKRSEIDVAAIGELLVDFTPVSVNADGFPLMQANAGGAPCNYLAALAKYGKSTAFIGKVGADTFGRLLLMALNRAGIGTRALVSDARYFTTLAFITLSPDGERDFSFARSPGADTMLEFDEIDLSVADEAHVLHFGSLSLTDEPARSAVQRLVDYAAVRGKLISFDPNLRRPLWKNEEQAKEQILWGLKKADIVKISDDEVFFLFGCSPEDGAARLIREHGVSLAMVTCGKDGCILKNRRAECRVPALSVNCADTTGAGDIFGGSAMKVLLDIGKAPDMLDKSELERVAVFASCAAGLSTERSGGIPSIPELEEVEAKLTALECHSGVERG